MVKKVSNSNERLRELMEIFNLKQSDIVRRTGIKKSALSNYLHSTREPRQDQISKISEPFGISPAWLMGYDVPMKMEITVEEPNNEQRLLLYMLSLLNEEGCAEALKRVEELTQLEKYKKV